MDDNKIDFRPQTLKCPWDCLSELQYLADKFKRLTTKDVSVPTQVMKSWGRLQRNSGASYHLYGSLMNAENFLHIDEISPVKNIKCHEIWGHVHLMDENVQYGIISWYGLIPQDEIIDCFTRKCAIDLYQYLPVNKGLN